MIVLEYEAKALLKTQGISVPRSTPIFVAIEATEAAVSIGKPVVVKAEVPAGGRMKAGGIRFANTPEAAESAASSLIGTTLNGFPVNCVLIEEKLAITAEVFFSVTYDAAARCAVVLASAEGGIDIESKRIGRWPFSLLNPPSEYLFREISASLGFTGQIFTGLATMMYRLAQCFIEWDALLLEVNPIILDKNGQWWAGDAHLELDDDALWRQQKVIAQVSHSVQISNRRSAFEQRAIEIDSADHRGVAGRLVPLGGTLGLLIGGGGASLSVLDAVLDAGLEPANYCEIGGNPSVWKITELTKLILSQPHVKRLAVIMNVVSNTRVDLVARGVIKGLLELGLDPRDVIAVFRIPGSWEGEGQALLNHYGVPYLGRETSIDQAVGMIKGI